MHLGYVKYFDILGTEEKTNKNRNQNVIWKSYTTEEQYNGHYTQYCKS